MNASVYAARTRISSRGRTRMMMQTMSVGAVALGARGRAGRARGGARLTSRNEAPLGARGWMREGRRGGGSVGGGGVRGMEMMRVRARRGAVVTRAESGDREGRGKGKGFIGGILLGGAVFGALGFLFAPQLSKTLLGGKRAVNKMLDEENEDELELTRQVSFWLFARLSIDVAFARREWEISLSLCAPDARVLTHLLSSSH